MGIGGRRRSIGNEGDEAVLPADTPASIEGLLQGYAWARNSAGTAGERFIASTVEAKRAFT
jgi:hypothetical protein